MTEHFQAAAAAAHPLAAAAATSSILNEAWITSTLATVLTIVILTLAIKAAFRAHRSETAGVLSMLLILGVAAMVWSVATGGDIPTLGADLVHGLLHL